MKELYPRSLPEALSLRRSSAATPVFGGTALAEQAEGAYLYLYGSEEFRRIDTDGTHVHIGSGCSFAQLQKEPLCPDNLQAAAKLCPPELQERAAIGGALADTQSAAVAALFALDAQLVLASETGRRSMSIRKFYRRKGLNLALDELICEILVPHRSPKNWAVELRGEGVERLSFAAVLRRKGGKITALTAAFGGLDTLVWRIPEFEEEMLGLDNRAASQLRGEFLNAYRRYLPASGADGEERREQCLRWLDEFLTKNGI